MPRAKFHQDPRKAVAVHKEQKTDRHTHTETDSVKIISFLENAVFVEL